MKNWTEPCGSLPALLTLIGESIRGRSLLRRVTKVQQYRRLRIRWVDLKELHSHPDVHPYLESGARPESVYLFDGDQCEVLLLRGLSRVMSASLLSHELAHYIDDLFHQRFLELKQISQSIEKDLTKALHKWRSQNENQSIEDFKWESLTLPQQNSIEEKRRRFRALNQMRVIQSEKFAYQLQNQISRDWLRANPELNDWVASHSNIEDLFLGRHRDEWITLQAQVKPAA